MILSIFLHIIGDVIDDSDVEDRCNDIDVYERKEFSNQDFLYQNSWPFPDPQKDLDKYLTREDTAYMDEFEKWWDLIQTNKEKIAESEYNTLIKKLELKSKRILKK